MPTISNWQDLPFSQIWAVDFEYYPGRGLGNGSNAGDAITPLCVTAIEMRTNRVVSLWQDEFGPFPTYRLDADSLFISYMTSADFGAHIALGWPQPACSLDPYVEFRHLANDGAVKSPERPKGFYSLDGALRYFGEQGIDTAHKTEMRDRIVQGPPFTAAERKQILAYCLEDTEALTVLIKHIVPTIRSLPHAMLRAKYMWAVAQQERRGVPVEKPMLDRILPRWDEIQLDLVIEKDRPFGVYEIVNGKPHWRDQRYADYMRRNGMAWPKHPSGALDLRDQTFRDMTPRYPQIATLREVRSTLSKLRLNSLQIGNDGRNRVLLSPFGTKTARSAPSNSKFLFGGPKWLRLLIVPPPGRALVYSDFCQQEVRVAGALSGDSALLQACEAGDVYLGIAGQLGFIKNSMSAVELESVRALFKTVVLGIQYGLGAAALAIRAGISLYEAREILARLRAQFRGFEAFAESVADHAGLDLEIGTSLGWFMKCPTGINPRTVRNFPVQGTASMILHVACILAERRGIQVVATIHDAILAEAPSDQIEEVAHALDRVMCDAAAIVLRGYELPTDKQIIRPGQRFFDKRGVEMFETVTRLVAKLEERRA
jgi:hypothetical protein